MTKADKKRFARELTQSVLKTVIANVDRMPEEWDGIELRDYIADKFDESRAFKHRPYMRKRASEYRNEVIVRNL